MGVERRKRVQKVVLEGRLAGFPECRIVLTEFTSHGGGFPELSPGCASFQELQYHITERREDLKRVEAEGRRYFSLKKLYLSGIPGH